MSFPQKGRNFQPTSGRTFPAYAINGGDRDFAAVIAGALRDAFGGTYAAIKIVGSYTGARERTVKNWFEAKNAPNGKNLVELARHSDEVLEAFLMMAGRKEILSAKKLVDARDKLVEMLEMIDQISG